MTSEAFVRQLDAENQALLARLAPDETLAPEVEGALNVVNLLKVALKNEVEATEIAARWLVTTADLDVKLAFARQVGDEARHYRLVAERLAALGFDARGFDPIAQRPHQIGAHHTELVAQDLRMYRIVHQRSDDLGVRRSDLQYRGPPVV